MSKDYNLAVFIGRFSPFHNEHLNVLKQGLKLADKVLIVIGSSTSATNIKNPFTFLERLQMIRESLSREENDRVIIRPVSDYFHNDNQWVAAIQNIVAETAEGNVCLLGSYKDASSYYLNLFPQWDFKPQKAITPMDATTIREAILDPKNVRIKNGWIEDRTITVMPDGFMDDSWKKMVPKGTLNILEQYFKDPKYVEHINEFRYIQEYKASWASAPFPVTFVTADAVVIKSGHILLIKRKFEPGKGLYALPGGFIKQDETIESAAIRELKEETRIKVDKPVLRSYIKDSKVFDFPQRSLRGRTITHCYFIDLGHGELPEVKANDDASGAFWIPINEFLKMEEKMFEDHQHLACHFLMKGV